MDIFKGTFKDLLERNKELRYTHAFYTHNEKEDKIEIEIMMDTGKRPLGEDGKKEILITMVKIPDLDFFLKDVKETLIFAMKNNMQISFDYHRS